MRKGFKTVLKVLFVLIVISIGLAFFYSKYKCYFIEEPIIETSGGLSINYDIGNKLFINGSKKVTFTVINSSNEDLYYYIEFKNPLNVKEGKIKYTLKNDDGLNVSGKLKGFTDIVSSYILIPAGGKQNYELDFSSKRKFSLELNVEVEATSNHTLAEAVLEDNKVKDAPMTIPGKQIAIEDEGLIKNTDDFGTTYYFRGNVKNNYVRIGNVMYRIVRINGDGSVKVVLDGVLGEQRKFYDSIGDYSYQNSSLASYLTNWFTTSYKDYKNLISNSKFCNDNNQSNGVFLSQKRIIKDNIPSFNCLGDVISVKVGLLTVDEIIYAGATLYEDNTAFYLYNSTIVGNYFTLTGYNNDGMDYYPFTVTPGGRIVNSDKGSDLHYIRPTLNIIKTVTVKGNGTYNDPYVLSKN